ncbi:hypothetical protein H5P28_04610 [Ruficoccus amylovorans]|uniref:Uncharacterized protein n=1 Tax=Ruficoccus amylovorans TaxID=1804625 RepID=A0A842HBT9_9BACT|nr:hypothetical protein [Ruficoccus amylovorans]MBC2593538.1 hypothetical protein [Ruficoccus amylovorans]
MGVFSVTGYTQHQGSGFMPARRMDYEFVVELSSWRDHREILNNYLEWYCGVDFEKNKAILSQIFTDRNCALAIVTFYLRELHQGIHDRFVRNALRIPTSPPEVEKSTYRLWIIGQEESEVMTEKNCAWELYKQCEWGKLSVAEAKDFIREKFPQQSFDWSKVLYQFGKYGGRYTKLYLRRD